MWFDLLLVLVSCSLTALYVGWQLRNLLAWRLNLKKPAPGPAGSHPSVAVLIPFRNEADNLPVIASSLLAQEYAGSLKIVFIDDHSTDGGAGSLPAGVTVLRLADHLRGQQTVAHKKAALAYAVATVSAEVIITTDADCDWPKDRVARIAEHFAGGKDIVLGPVLIAPMANFCSAFQALDLAAYQFLTAATARMGRPVLANGANFAFRKTLFEQVGGYAGVDHLPSGDDVLLLHKFLRERGSKDGFDAPSPLTPNCVYAAEASVSTRPVAGWRALWYQRLRWAGKAGEYTNPGLQFAQALTFGLSLAIVSALLFYPLLPRPRLLLMLWGGKALIDLICLWPVMRHFGQAFALRWYPAAALLYPFFLVAVGGAALLGFKSGWKGRL